MFHPYNLRSPNKGPAFSRTEYRTAGWLVETPRYRFTSSGRCEHRTALGWCSAAAVRGLEDVEHREFGSLAMFFFFFFLLVWLFVSWWGLWQLLGCFSMFFDVFRWFEAFVVFFRLALEHVWALMALPKWSFLVFVGLLLSQSPRQSSSWARPMTTFFGGGVVWACKVTSSKRVLSGFSCFILLVESFPIDKGSWFLNFKVFIVLSGGIGEKVDHGWSVLVSCD